MNKYVAIGFMVFLNAFDACCTNQALALGTATERNPIMRWLWEYDITYFFGAKILATLVWCLLVWAYWDRSYARFAGYVGLFFLSLVVGYQMVYLPNLICGRGM